MQNNISKILLDYGSLSINSNIFVDFSDIKKHLSYIPLKSKSNVFHFTHLLDKMKKSNGYYDVYVGNKKITTLRPQYFKMSNNCPKEYTVMIDEKLKNIKSPSSFLINDDIKVLKSKNIRVNVIGCHVCGLLNESDINIHRNNINKKFSID